VPNALITPSLIARVGLATLYNTTVLAGLVWRDFDESFTGKQGDTITIRKPAVFAAQDFNRATGIVLQSINEGSIPLKLDHLADVSFPVTAEELTLNIDDFSARLLTPAMEAIVQKVDVAIGEAAVDAAKGPGGGGTAVMDAKANDVMIEAREKLTTNKLPATGRFAVLSPAGTSVALKDPLFVEADTSGSTDALREASRALQAPMGVSASQVAIESYKGLTLRVVYSYDQKYKQDVISVDFLYGIAATRPEGAVALDMGQGS
jgi:hypothetical protein